MLQTSIVGEVKTTATIVDTKINDNPSFFDQMNGSGMVEDLQSIPESLNSSTDSLKENTALLKEFGNIMPEMIKNLRAMNDIVSRTNQNLPAIRKNITTEDARVRRQGALLDQSVLGLVNNGNGMLQSYANGNFGGVVSGAINGASNTVNNLSKMAENADMGDMAKLLTKLGVGVAIAGAVVKGADVLANKYIDEMPTIFGSGRAFGNMSNAGAMAAYDRINSYNVGTNLSISEFQGIAQSLRKQGVGNGLSRDAQFDLVGNIAARTGQLAYMTGGDASQYASLAGLMSRYGGSKDVVGDFEKLIASGKASGLNDTQIPEFLSGIQKVMEDGIAKGFTRSATDVASTMLMFSKMSGNSAFWQGEQGARILNQANAGLASATGLSKTADILAYRAINRAFGTESAKEAQLGSELYLKGGGYVNNMMLLEQGLNAKNFGAIMGAIGESTTSKEGQIERIRQMFGVNYSGASRILQLDPSKFNNEAEFEAELKKIQNDPLLQNNETRNQKALNDIKAEVVKVGEGLANLKISGMEGIAGSVNKITNWLGMDYESRYKEYEAQKIIEGMTDYQAAFVFQQALYGNNINDLETLQAIAEWNGVGSPKGFENNFIVKDSTGSNIIEDALTGASENGVELNGRIKSSDTAAINTYLRTFYGEEILNALGGDEDLYNVIIDSYLSNSKLKDKLDKKNPLYNKIQGLRRSIQNETEDEVRYSDEPAAKDTADLLSNILEELKNLEIVERR